MPELLSFDLAIFLFGTVAAAFVTGLSGFAFGMVAAAVWFYALPPPQASALIAAYALLVQGYAVWKLRHLLDPHRLMPFILGSALGIPVGVAAVRWASPIYLRIGVGLLLVLFSLYNLARPKLPEMKQAGRVADGAVGVLNGVLGGATGLAGIVTVIWTSIPSACSCRPKRRHGRRTRAGSIRSATRAHHRARRNGGVGARATRARGGKKISHCRIVP
jgi:uncharacterized membrane protein YfcA